MKENQTFAEKHPKINFLIGLLLLIGMVIAAVLLIRHAADGNLYLYDMVNIKKEMSTPLEQ